MNTSRVFVVLGIQGRSPFGVKITEVEIPSLYVANGGDLIKIVNLTLLQ